MRWRLLLILPLFGVVLGPLYAARTPMFLGIAFFYWYEFACVLVSAAVAWLVYPPEPLRRAGPFSSARVEDQPRFSRDPAIRLRPRARARS
jgi:Protein of unknown function (DUF3311)